MKSELNRWFRCLVVIAALIGLGSSSAHARVLVSASIDSVALAANQKNAPQPNIQSSAQASPDRQPLSRIQKTYFQGKLIQTVAPDGTLTLFKHFKDDVLEIKILDEQVVGIRGTGKTRWHRLSAEL